MMDRIKEHLQKHDSGCWTLGDYGGRRAIIRYRGENFSARTLLWEQQHGEVPTGRQLRATCRDMRCVNPSHCRVASGTMQDRIDTWSKPNTNGCVEWFGCVGGGGYGLIRHLGRNYPAHRVAYELKFGKIPKGMLVCHRCDNPPCVNADHLFIGTMQDNSTDMVQKGRSFCGETHHSARLTPESVLQIRALHGSGKPVNHIAKMFGLSFSSTKKVIDRVSWKHIYAPTQK